MARMIIGSILCVWGLLLLLPAILSSTELEVPRVAQFAVPFVFLIPGAILIYAGRKAREKRKNQSSVATKAAQNKSDDRIGQVQYPSVQKEKEHRIHSREEVVWLIHEILNSTDVTPAGLREQEGRINKLTKLGHDFASDIESAIRSSAQAGSSEYTYKNAGLLCEALGKTKGANTFNILSGMLTLKTDVQEYRHIRTGAVRGLMHLGNKRAISLLKDLKEPDVPQSTIDEVIQSIESKSISARAPDASTNGMTQKDSSNEFREGKCPVCKMRIELSSAKTRVDSYQYFEKHIYTTDYFCPRCFDKIDYMKGWLVDYHGKQIRDKRED